VAIPFVGSQVGFATAFLNPFNVGVAQGIAGVDIFSGMGYRAICWVVATTVTIGFLMWWAARIKRQPELSPTFEMDQERRRTLDMAGFENFAGMTGRHKLVLWIFAAALVSMIFGVVKFG
jgi:uncharacterized ion transporter superfamily protein YfcC